MAFGTRSDFFDEDRLGTLLKTCWVIPFQTIPKKTILNPTPSEPKEIWHTCWFWPPTSHLKFFIDQMIGFRDM